MNPGFYKPCLAVLLLLMFNNINGGPIAAIIFQPSTNDLLAILSITVREDTAVNLEYVTLEAVFISIYKRRTDEESYVAITRKTDVTNDIGSWTVASDVYKYQVLDWSVKNLTQEVLYNGYQYKVSFITKMNYPPGLRSDSATAIFVAPPLPIAKIKIVPSTYLKMKVLNYGSPTNYFDKLNVFYNKNAEMKSIAVILQSNHTNESVYDVRAVSESQEVRIYLLSKNISSYRPIYQRINTDIPLVNITQAEWQEEPRQLQVQIAANRDDMDTLKLQMNTLHANTKRISFKLKTNYSHSHTIKISYDEFTKREIQSGLINLTAEISGGTLKSAQSNVFATHIPPLPPNQVECFAKDVLEVQWELPTREYDYLIIIVRLNDRIISTTSLPSQDERKSWSLEIKSGIVALVELYTVKDGVIKSTNVLRAITIPVSNLVSQQILFSKVKSSKYVREAKFIIKMEAKSLENAEFDEVYVNMSYSRLNREERLPLISLRISSEEFHVPNISSGSPTTSLRAYVQEVDLDDYQMAADHPIPGAFYVFTMQVRGVTFSNITSKTLTAPPTPPINFTLNTTSGLQELNFSWELDQSSIYDGLLLKICLQRKRTNCFHNTVLPSHLLNYSIMKPKEFGLYSACLFTQSNGVKSSCSCRSTIIENPHKLKIHLQLAKTREFKLIAALLLLSLITLTAFYWAHLNSKLKRMQRNRRGFRRRKMKK